MIELVDAVVKLCKLVVGVVRRPWGNLIMIMIMMMMMIMVMVTMSLNYGTSSEAMKYINE